MNKMKLKDKEIKAFGMDSGERYFKKEDIKKAVLEFDKYMKDMINNEIYDYEDNKKENLDKFHSIFGDFNEV